MSDDTSTTPNALADYLAILGRRKWVIIQALILAPVAAVLLSLSQPAQYQAVSNVLLSQQDIASQVSGIQANPSQDPIRFVQTQAQLARVPQVAERAVQLAGVRDLTAAGLLASSDVVPKTDADVLRFIVSGRDPAIALRMANAYAKAFTEYRQQLETASIQSARNQLLDRLQQLRTAGKTNTDQYTGIADKEQQLRTLQLLQQSNSVVSPAGSAVKTAPTPKRNGILALILGGLLGVSVAFLWEALDRRVRSAKEIEETLARPVLARLAPPPRRYRRGLAMIDDPRSMAAESFRRLRANIEFANLDSAARTIMVSSAVPQEGKSTTVSNLGIAFAEARMKVIVVDFDLRKPSLGEIFDYPPRPGVTEVIRSQIGLDEALLPINVQSSSTGRAQQRSNNGPPKAAQSDFSLRVLPAGLSLPLDPSQLIHSAAFERLMKEISARADVVLIDAPPLLAVAETTPLSLKVDAMVIVSRVGVVPRSALADLARVIEMSPTPTLGIVVTGVSGTATGYGTYGYGDTGDQPETRRVTVARALGPS